MTRIGVGFETQFSVRSLNAVLVNIVNFQSLDKTLPYTVVYFVHRVFFSVPVIEIADYAHRLRVGRPYAETPAFSAVAYRLVW